MCISISYFDKKIACVIGKLRELFQTNQKEKMVLVMILFLYQMEKNLHFAKCPSKKYKIRS